VRGVQVPGLGVLNVDGFDNSAGIVEILRERPGRRYTAGELASRLGIIGSTEYCRRIIHKTIQQLRLDGFPICSASDKDGGYWWPVDRQDAIAGYLVQRSRVRTQLTTLNRWKKAIARTFPPKPPEPIQERLI